MRNLNQKILGPADAAAAQVSAQIDASQLYALSLQAVVTGGATGTLKLMGSNEPTNPTSFTQITTAVLAAGTTAMIPFTNISYQWITAAWTPTAGAGTVTVYLNAQGF